MIKKIKHRLLMFMDNYSKDYANSITTLSWILLTLAYINECFVKQLIDNSFNKKYTILVTCIFILICMTLLIEILLKKILNSKEKINIIFYYLEVAIAVITFEVLSRPLWVTVLIILPVVNISFERDYKDVLKFIVYLFGVNITTFLIGKLFLFDLLSLKNMDNFFHLINLIFFYMLIAILARMCNIVHNQHEKSVKDNQNLVMQLGQKYAQLEIAQNEIKTHYDRLKETNIKLEQSNKKLTDSVAEFYTLQQISQAISSIFEVNELLKFVNDIILGVMGATNSTIALYDQYKDRLIINVSNITSKKEFALLSDNINQPFFKEILDKGEPTIENQIKEKEYPFTVGRDVKSIICVPIKGKGSGQGIVLIEHSLTNAFDEDTVRLLNIIAQQVSIAIENAVLYQKMHELATQDGLTKIYNRIFFQQKLTEEIKRAEEKSYPISVVIFDIDHFKLFNDTFGHLFGDEVLKNLAKKVKQMVRKDDIFARYGGEEFIILMPRTNLANAYEKSEKIREAIENMVVKDKVVEASITISMGISSYPNPAPNESILLKTADDALYNAKDSGRNCVKIAQ